MTPKISVIVPVYKVEKYLPKCIDSILAQTFTDFELLLIDDGSPDNSGYICDEYAKKDSRIRVFHKENGGASSARNLGIDESKGEWIQFVDADDYLSNDAFATCFKNINPNNLDLLLVGGIVVSTLGMKKGCNFTPELQSHTVNQIDFLKSYKGGWAVWCFIIKSSILKDNNIKFIEGIVMEDVEIIPRLISKCNNLMAIPDHLYFYNKMNESSLTTIQNSSIINKRFRSLYVIISSLCEFLNNNEISLEFKEEVYKKVIAPNIETFLFAPVNFLSITLSLYVNVYRRIGVITNQYHLPYESTNRLITKVKFLFINNALLFYMLIFFVSIFKRITSVICRRIYLKDL